MKAPGFGDHRKAQLQDIAVMTGAEFITEDTGRKLEDVPPRGVSGVFMHFFIESVVFLGVLIESVVFLGVLIESVVFLGV